ncbi:MAG: hypothetical protein K2K31_03840 [Clostridia bacterium]|nr:hypothetical protein [Clostridia bacterium]
MKKESCLKSKEIKSFTIPTQVNMGKITSREITDGVLRGFVICIYQDHGETMCHIFNPKFTEEESMGLIGKYNDDLKEEVIVDYLIDCVAQESAQYCMDMVSKIYFNKAKPREYTENDLLPRLKNLPNPCHMFESQRVIDKTVEHIDRLRDAKFGSGHNLIIEAILIEQKNKYLNAYKNSIADITASDLKIPKLKIESKEPTKKPNDGRGGIGDGNN